MENSSSYGPRKTRRTANACIACRHSKIKCTGEAPCANCQRRSLRCEFVEGVNRVVVSERYLRQLEKEVEEHRQLAGVRSPPESPLESQTRLKDTSIADSTGMLSDSADEPLQLQGFGYAQSIWTSPFTLPSTTIRNNQQNKRTWIWLAPSSMWSFTTRLTIMMTEKLQLRNTHPSPTSEKESYPIRWEACSAGELPDISGLPSLDHALYLSETVRFHLGQSYRLYNEDEFIHNVREFYYGDAAKMATEHRLWFIQFLLVLAFGTAFLHRSKRAKEPPGSKFFTRAMSLMPDHAPLWKGSLLAIEVLAMAGLYLYSIDQRESAHIYVRQAIQIAQFEGLHTHLPEEQLGAETVSRCRDLWWTLYILDRHFSYSVGLPMMTQDSDISTPIDPPSTCSHRDIVMSLQAKLAHLLSNILNTVYKTEKTQVGSFLEMTRSTLQTLAGHAQEVEKIIHVRFSNSVDTMPKGTRHITLLYHQCVIVATRPLLLSALIERLENLDHEREYWRSFLALTKTLISIGIKSAVKMLQILSNDDNLLEIFLPYDLEFTYAAALHLAMANAVFPQALDGQAYLEEAHRILDEMISNGNKVAEVRKAELVHLEMLFEELATRVKAQGLQPLTLVSPAGAEAVPQAQGVEEDGDGETVTDIGVWDLPIPGDSLTSHPADMQMSSVELLNNIGISSSDFLYIVDQIGNPDVSYSILDLGRGGDMD
ncbi:hypothetical protein BDV37DRAFT_295264 [Aspergillus pseudonomiae]|uniref:Zn(2)-C6 fungal-type domain-containing protein n=1 Tax=Aspergillus pseudonomiae TaxID=1506151 RepID=A0A5N7DQF5_9EURO|nr:uncharacterized protein BDV37DRAFT_295264 [Aspergillus pseudonomiae]KAE8408672.1 hypothetical protein BDV37DRAFT_295264 [Aspergillus pseudonomiae]